MIVEKFNSLWDEILSKKIIRKNKQYGNSIEEPALIFNDIDDPSILIRARIDDKLARLKVLDKDSEKYPSEVKELIAYLMWELVMLDEKYTDSDRHEGNKVKSAKDIRKVCDSHLPTLGLRRLPDK
jgi:hypothetical protein